MRDDLPIRGFPTFAPLVDTILVKNQLHGMKNMVRIIVIGILAVLAVLFFSSDSMKDILGMGARSPYTGRTCTVQFRRGDALGGAGSLPVSPLTSNINGADTAISGKIRRVTEEWIVMDRANGTEIWIPKSAVLLVQF